MKLLITLDLFQPLVKEQEHNTHYAKNFHQELSAVAADWQIDLLLAQNPIRLQDDHTQKELWAQNTSSLEAAIIYQEEAPSPLESYDLIIGVNLGPGAIQFFSKRGQRLITLRSLPWLGTHDLWLARTNVVFPKKYEATIPDFAAYYLHQYSLTPLEQKERAWWLCNRFLINPDHRYPNTLILGSSEFQTEKISKGKLLSLYDFEKELLEYIETSPNFYYAYQHPVDNLEPRLLKKFMVNVLSLKIPELLIRPEIDQLISLDSGFVPFAKKFKKPITILGPQAKIDWTPVRYRNLCQPEFYEALLAHPLSSDLELG